MKNQRGSTTIWIIVMLVAVITAGAMYWYWAQNSDQPTSVISEAPTVPTEQTTQQNVSATQSPTADRPSQPNPSSAATTSSRNYNIFKASPTSGSAPLMVTFTYSFDANAMGAASDQFLMDFGDGMQGANSTGTHTYTSAGTYIATISFKNSVEGPSSYVPLKDSSGNLLSQTITVTNSSTRSSASIDRDSLISSTTPKLSGSVSGTSHIIVAIWPGKLDPSQMTPSVNNEPFWSSNTEIRDPEVQVANGRWYTSIGNSEVAGLGAPIPYFPNGIYTISVSDYSTSQILTSAQLEVTGPSIDVTSATASTVMFSYADLPANSQVLLVGQSNNPPTVATVSGSGSDSISIPGGLQGTYWLQVELKGNANNILQSGPFSANEVGR